MFSIIVFIVVLSILIFVHELGHFMVAKKTGVRVEQFSLGFGPRLFTWKKSQTEYTVCVIPLGGYVKLAGDNPEEFHGKPDEYLSKSIGQRARIIFFGPLLNYILAFLCFWLIFFLGSPNLACRVGGLIEDFGAQEAGILEDDKILAIDGQRVELWQDLQKIVHKKTGGEIATISILRDSQELEFSVKIKQKKMDTLWGEQETVGLLGIQPADEYIKVQYGLGRSFFEGGRRLFYFTGVTLKSLVWMILGKTSFRQSVTGPVGIFYITKEAADVGIVPLMHVIAIISMSLAIFNLLPMPVLDGGHLFLLAIERLRGRRLNIRVERWITQIGFSIILLLIASVFYNDLLRYDVFTKIQQWWTP